MWKCPLNALDHIHIWQLSPQLATPYGIMELGQHWSRWWLVAWWHQAITWNAVDLSSKTLRIILQEVMNYETCLKGTQPHLLGASELMSARINLIIPPTSMKLKGGYTGFTLPICPSIRSISYSHILSRNFRRCVTYKVCFKIKRFDNLAGKFFKFVTLALSCFDLGSNMTQ